MELTYKRVVLLGCIFLDLALRAFAEEGELYFKCCLDLFFVVIGFQLEVQFVLHPVLY